MEINSASLGVAVEAVAEPEPVAQVGTIFKTSQI